MSNRTNRGIMVQEIVERSINENPFDTNDEFKESLQNEFKTNLTFEVGISDIEIRNGFNFFQVYFENENQVKSVLDFTISYNKTSEIYV